jgi:hypothetical protein
MGSNRPQPILFGRSSLEWGFVAHGRSDSSIQAATGMIGKAGHYGQFFSVGEVRDE